MSSDRSSAESRLEQRVTYHIPVDEFKRQDFVFVPYRLGDRVSRENFSSFLILSFALSRGKPKAQVLFFLLVDKVTGFDYKNTLTNFFTAGGWSALLPAERQKMVNVFCGAKGKAGQEHRDAAADEGGDPVFVVMAEVKRLQTLPSLAGGVFGEKINLGQVNDLNDIMPVLDQYIDSLKI